MNHENSKIPIGITSTGIAIYLPCDDQLLLKLTKKDLAEAKAIFEFVFRQIDQNTQLLPFVLTMQMIQDALADINLEITDEEARSILKTKTDDEFLGHGGKLVFQEFKASQILSNMN